MKVLLIDIDSAIPNLALMKLAAWHREQGDEVALGGMERPDRVYASSVFTWGRQRVERIRAVYPEMRVGGSGLSLIETLPAEVEACEPDYSLYETRWPDWRGIGLGFLQRGCPRSCGFCVVPRKEGKAHSVAGLDELINPNWKQEGWKRPFVCLLDNNFLALGDWTLDRLAEIAERGIDVSFTQGLDIRLVTPETAAALSRVRFWNLHHTRRQMTFAFDHVGIEPMFRHGVSLLFEAGIKAWQLQSFVLCGFNSTIDEDLHRIEVIRSLGIDPFVMVYRDPDTGLAPTDRRLRCFARWINRRLYKVCEWERYAAWEKAQLQPELMVVTA